MPNIRVELTDVELEAFKQLAGAHRRKIGAEAAYLIVEQCFYAGLIRSKLPELPLEYDPLAAVSPDDDENSRVLG